MNLQRKPIMLAKAVVMEEKTLFFLHDKKVELEVEGSAIQALIERFDGSSKAIDIVQELSTRWGKEDLERLVDELYTLGVVCDCWDTLRSTWPLVKNPTRFTSGITDEQIAELVNKSRQQHSFSSTEVFDVEMSPFLNLLEKRKSTRYFSEESIGGRDLIRMLWAAYGELRITEERDLGRRTTPSAGGLYPIALRLVLLRPVETFASGVYKIDTSTPGRIGLEKIIDDVEPVKRAFSDPLMLEVNGPIGVLVISGSFKWSGQKYGNRSILYVSLEAGHIAQNVHCAAHESGVATTEIGGFAEDALGAATCVPEEYIPLTTILFGKESAQIEREDGEVELEWALSRSGAYVLPFAMAFARLRKEPPGEWSCGRSTSIALAKTKATSEAREWAACGFVPERIDEGRISEMKHVIDPRSIVRYSQNQYAREEFPFRPFDETVRYSWVRATEEFTGREVFVLADTVYFPYQPIYPRYTHASSSGVAAHPNAKQALQSAVLELLERDSFMATYLNRLSMPNIDPNSLPRQLQKRICDLNKAGFRVWIKDVTLEYAPVVFVIAQSSTYRYTTCSGCAGFDKEHILDHALMEVESSVFCRLTGGPLDAIAPEQVRNPSDHDRLYAQDAYYQASNFLFKNGTTVGFGSFGQSGASSWESLLDRFSRNRLNVVSVPLTIPKSHGGNKGLHINRVFIPGLIPISFGYDEEPLGMERIGSIGQRYGTLFQAPSGPLFPHPYI